MYKTIILAAAIVLSSCSTPEPQPLTMEQQVERQFSVFSGEHRDLSKRIKKTIDDPDSYKHIQTMYWLRKDTVVFVKTEFTYGNLYGGKNRGEVGALYEVDGQLREILYFD
jgi:hypothetical protein